MRRCADRNPSGAENSPCKSFVANSSLRSRHSRKRDDHKRVGDHNVAGLRLAGAEYGADCSPIGKSAIADSAAFIAATYCGANSECSTTTTLNTATAIAQNIGALNGIPPRM